ncbi:hypothetical protein FPSE5266_09064 [Fusarium pseudograminearum]|nr:hypothetical protein FPSE5266_09064 [Fusarium pseudograminearum]
MTTSIHSGNPSRHQYNAAVGDLRESEFPMIKDSIYLDHAGSTLCSMSLMDAFAHEMTTVLYGNPHSASPSSQQSTSRVEDARMNLLTFFGADPTEYDVVFVANATAGVKLVVDAMRTQPQGFQYAYHQACHTSLVGVREEAVASISIDNSDIESWIQGKSPFRDTTNSSPITLFAYPAQSHMEGRRYPLSWTNHIQTTPQNTGHRILTLLDASSFVATSRLDLNNPQISPDFTVLSLYKIFGFPDLGALLVKRSSEWVFDNRRYFGGGTVDMVVSGKEKWHAPKPYSLHERLEDGTLPFHNIVALDIAMKVHEKLFGSMDQVSSHTSYLSQRMLQGLANLRHANDTPVYVPSPPDSDSEQHKTSRILLSNESPILMIHSSSVDALNQDITRRGGNPAEDKSFRANIVLGRAPGFKALSAFSEDSWDSVHIGLQSFKLMGACRRCQMVCIDQDTGEKKEEPFVTLAKTRRFDGKVYFGVHMRHDPLAHGDLTSKESQYPTIHVGDSVSVQYRG